MLISVIMSVYNSDEYLELSIDSILNQTYKDFEFILIDDGSTDRSVEICKRYADADSRIIFLQNEKNLGLGESLNKGIKIAKGEYIARQDADDISTLDRFEIQLKYALENKHIDMIGSNCYVIDINGETVFKDTSFSKEANFIDALLNERAIFPHGSAFLKKDKLIEAGLYDPRFYYTQDGELWLRLITRGATAHVIEEPLYYYRVSPIANGNRRPAKQKFNNVLQMMYAQSKSEALVNEELNNIRDFLAGAKAPKRKNYVAEYWKGLGNTAYLNSWNVKQSFKYIGRALKENSSPSYYPKCLMLGLMYLLPPGLVKPVLRLKKAA